MGREEERASVTGKTQGGILESGCNEKSLKPEDYEGIVEHVTCGVQECEA